MQDKNAEKKFFNRFGTHIDYDVFDERGYKRLVYEFLKYLKPLQKEKERLKIIDFGCGTGSFTGKFLNCGFELYGVDISEKCISYARKKYPDISFEVGDIEHTKWQDGSFDVVFLTGVLHHFSDFSEAVKECYRILKKEGIILGYDPHRGNPFMWLYRCKESPFYSSKGVTENERPLSKREIENVFVYCGFSETRIHSIAGVTYKYFDNKLSSLILPVYNFIERIIDFKPLRDRFGSFLITYSKK